MCVLFKETLVNIYHCFINIELTASNTVTQPEQSPSNTRIFPIRHITSCSHLGTQESTSAQQLEAILNDKISNKKLKKCRKHVTKQTVEKKKTTCLQPESWSCPRWGITPPASQCLWLCLCMCANVHKGTAHTGGYRSILASRWFCR